MSLKSLISRERSSLAQLIVGRDNNLNLIRLLCATAVIFGHIFAQLGRGLDPIRKALVVEYPGSLSVYVFFFLSGILVCASYERNRSWLAFIILRFFRIWPGLAICVLVIYGFIVPVFSPSPYAEVLQSWETKRCILNNLALLHAMCIGHTAVFLHASLVHGVDYPLWTLPMECACYLIVLALGLLGILKRPKLCLFACILLFSAFIAVTYFPPAGAMHQWFIVMGGYSFFPIPFFILGIVCYAYRTHIWADWRVCLALFVSAALFKWKILALLCLYLGVAMLVLVLAAAKWLPRPSIFRNDYSYGVYIYGFTVGQCIDAIKPNINVYLAFAINVIIAVLVAALSWHFVEKPCLRLGHIIAKKVSTLTLIPAPAFPQKETS